MCMCMYVYVCVSEYVCECVCGRAREYRRMEGVRMGESNILLGQTSGIICKMKEATKFVIIPLKS